MHRESRGMTAWLPTIQLFATLAMVGVIWSVQLVIYPQLHEVSAEGFRAYHAGHVQRIGPLVMPLMAIEGLAALALFVTGARTPGATVAFALLAVCWLSTAFLQVPLHGRLSAGRDVAAITALVNTNWLRTVAWTARGILLLKAAQAA